MEIHLDNTQLRSLRAAIEKLPIQIKTKAMRRAMVRMQEMARTRIVERNSKHVQLTKDIVRDLTTAHFNAGGNTSKLVVESGWIHLQRLGAVQSPAGVYVNLRGSYRSAFIASFKSGHVGVMRRISGTTMRKVRKEQIRELFGPNPAHAITNNPDVYLDVLAELIEQELQPRYMHEIDRLLPR